MRVTAIGLLLAAEWLYGQQTAAQSVDKVLYFANTDSRQGMQEITNAIRAITGIPGTLDSTQPTLEVSGTAKEIELAEWVFNELDRPATTQAAESPNSTTYTEQLLNGKTLSEVVRVFYFTNRPSPKRIQETVNTIRAITEIVRLMPFNERSAILLRGSVDRMGLAEWLFSELNQPLTAQNSGVLQYRLLPATADPDHSDLTRIFYLSGTANAQQIINAIRSSTKVTRIMPMPEQNVLVVRASDSLMTDAAALVQQLDSPSTKQ
jgi:type II secretory pathway component GspD/PulD (secretin)